MSRTLLLSLFFVLLILSACKLTPKTTTNTYKCPDGRLVDNLTECGIPEEDNTTDLPPASTNQTPINTTPPDERNFSTLRRKTNETEIKTDGVVPNLNGWSVQEIVGGMSAYNNDFLGVYATNVRYETISNTYTLGNDGEPLQDPFWVARAPYSGKTQEYNINQFRISIPQTPYEFYDMVHNKHNDSKFKIVYPEHWAEWEKISCEKLSSCRNIEAIECQNGNHTLYMWTHNTPGQGYTESTIYNMQAVDDNRETLDTFEKFYCTPV